MHIKSGLKSEVLKFGIGLHIFFFVFLFVRLIQQKEPENT